MGKQVPTFDWEGKHITRREAEVLLCGARGLTNSQTAEKLFISINTVERHRENVRDRFDLHGPHALAYWAVKMQPQLEKWVDAPIDK